MPRAAIVWYTNFEYSTVLEFINMQWQLPWKCIERVESVSLVHGLIRFFYTAYELITCYLQLEHIFLA